MEIQQLRHLIAAGESRNLFAAADKACISQSGLSRSLKNLELRLGLPLLTRGPKGIELTIYGRTLVRHAKVVLNEVARSIEELRALEQGRTGDTAFGVTQNFGSYLIPEVLAELHAERPGLRVTVVTDGFMELLKKVKAEEIDFAFVLIGRIHYGDGLVTEPLADSRTIVLARSDHPLAGREDIAAEDLARYDWAMISTESVQRGFQLFFESRGLPVPPQILKCNSVAMIRHVVAATDALMIFPREVVQAELDAGTLTVLDCEAPVERTRIGLVFREGGMLTPQAEIVVRRIRAAVSAHAACAETWGGKPRTAAVG